MGFFIKAGYWFERRIGLKGELNISRIASEEASAIVSSTAFTGTLSLEKAAGKIWSDLNQSGALVITVGPSAKEGGSDNVRIVADGNTITLDAAFTWVKMSSDSIGTTAADVNELIFVGKKFNYNSAGAITGGTILYSVKLNP